MSTTTFTSGFAARSDGARLRTTALRVNARDTGDIVQCRELGQRHGSVARETPCRRKPESLCIVERLDVDDLVLRGAAQVLCNLEADADAVDWVLVAFVEDLPAGDIRFDAGEHHAGGREELDKSERAFLRSAPRNRLSRPRSFACRC